MTELNLSVKVLTNKSPYLFVWWNEKDDCADGILVTCKCQGFQLEKTASQAKKATTESALDKPPGWYPNLAGALKCAEIVTVNPSRIAMSLCKQSDVVQVPAKKKKKRKKKRKGNKKSRKSKVKESDETDIEQIEEDDMEYHVVEAGGVDVEGSGDVDASGTSAMDYVEDQNNGENRPNIIAEEAECSKVFIDVANEERVVDDTEGEANNVSMVHDENMEYSSKEQIIAKVVANFESENGLNLPASSSSGTDNTVVFNASDVLNSMGQAQLVDDPNTSIPMVTFSQAIHDLFMSAGTAAESHPEDSSPVPVAGIYQLDVDYNTMTAEESAKLTEYFALKNKAYLANCNKKQGKKHAFKLCEYCGAPLSSKTYKQHVEAVHFKGERTGLYSCPICDKKFLYESNVKRHQSIHSNTRFQCQFCPKSFSQEGKCRNHEKTQHQSREDASSESMSKGWYYDKTRIENKNRIYVGALTNATCQICGKTIKKSSMRNHMETHNSEPVSCQKCGRYFSSKASMKMHMKTHGEKQHVCEICGKRFHFKQTLRSHMLVHTKEKPIKCNYCDMMFARHHTRINHERRHTGEKPYGCNICEKAWSDRTTYYQHMQKHHPNEPLVYLRKRPIQVE